MKIDTQIGPPRVLLAGVGPAMTRGSEPGQITADLRGERA